MNNWMVILISGITSIGISFYAIVLKPAIQLTQIRPLPLGAGEIYPSPRPGSALIGMQTYRSLGCYYCHTRIVKPYQFGSDYERGWGFRRAVARDYIADNPPLLGSTRLGPDLMNIASRAPEKYAVKWSFSSTNKTEQSIQKKARFLLILYDPRLLNPDSIMPSYKYLFSEQNQYSKDALNPQARGIFLFKSNQIIPGDKAERLADFLDSMKYEQPLYEAPAPPEPMNVINRPSALTNVFKNNTSDLPK
ncbi:MAG: cbb3-type cytochrome c oxidase subunit II [Verrucomicrobiia bacterium]